MLPDTPTVVQLDKSVEVTLPQPVIQALSLLLYDLHRRRRTFVRKSGLPSRSSYTKDALVLRQERALDEIVKLIDALERLGNQRSAEPPAG